MKERCRNKPFPEKLIAERWRKKLIAEKCIAEQKKVILESCFFSVSCKKHTETLWVYEDDKMVKRQISYVPGLYKIFDEILVNAADNKQRDPTMNSLKVVIDMANNLISVYNNGKGVPIEVHEEEGVYVPELIFGNLLFSSNPHDTVEMITGWRNGYGAKLTNAFSTEFVIETADGSRLKKYMQVFSNNMGEKSEPVITECKQGENWTMVSYKPDLARFSMNMLEDDVVSLLKKRVIDVAACLGQSVKVELNGKRVPIKSFREYVKLFLVTDTESSEAPKSFFYYKVCDRCEICVSTTDGQFQQVSFVNAIATIKGGSHVDYITNQISNYVVGVVKKKSKNADIKPCDVKNYLWVFVNALIDHPVFESQTNETLDQSSNFGSKFELPKVFLQKVAKSSDIVEKLLSLANCRLDKHLKKIRRRLNIPKLEDAKEAGTKNSNKCTLILTEGDSAKTFVISGFGALTQEVRNLYGVFPLRGKLLNVREATAKQLKENKEIESIKKILGLEQHKEYDSVKQLRYGHLMIMTDQDYDGSHIKGLLINYIHHFWPSLLKVPSFMVEFITPIVKATPKNGEVLAFYTMPEYLSWKESLNGNASGWTIKYYKGLGTNSKSEAVQYFTDIVMHQKDFACLDYEDSNAIELAFSKKRIEDRKQWLMEFEPGTHLDHTKKQIKISEFINKELILYSVSDVRRSIPCIVDGLKPAKRKILFSCFKRNLVTDIKVSQLQGYVAEHSAYHHGERSLCTTIIGMAQNFVGSNNINLLAPNGQFGTRCTGGKDYASPRYICTCLSPITRFLFPKDDDRLLVYLDDDGISIEPTWYAPIIPMVLVNGAEGIGTGWSTSIPRYHPRVIVANLRRLLNHLEMEPMHPWYRGFVGSIANNSGSYTVSGEIMQLGAEMVRITELPIGCWTEDYKLWLNSVREGFKDDAGNLPKNPFIMDFYDYGDDETVVLEVTLSKEKMKEANQEGLLKKFRLTTTICTSNMHLLDLEGVIKRYESPEAILQDFFHFRLECYEKRKNLKVLDCEREALIIENQVRFIHKVIMGEINLNRTDLFMELHRKGFSPVPKKESIESMLFRSTDEVNGVRSSDYDYLVFMPFISMAPEKVKQLSEDQEKINRDLEKLRETTSEDLWLSDLDLLELEIDKLDWEERIGKRASEYKSFSKKFAQYDSENEDYSTDSGL